MTESRAEKTACSKPCDLIPLEDKHFSLPRFPHKSNLKAATAVMTSLEERSSAVLSGLPVGLVQEAAVQSQKKFLSLNLSFLSFTFRAQVWLLSSVSVQKAVFWCILKATLDLSSVGGMVIRCLDQVWQKIGRKKVGSVFLPTALDSCNYYPFFYRLLESREDNNSVLPSGGKWIWLNGSWGVRHWLCTTEECGFHATSEEVSQEQWPSCSAAIFYEANKRHKSHIWAHCFQSG